MEQHLLKHKILVGQIFRYIEDFPPGFRWNTEGYRMIIIDEEGEYLSYKNGLLLDGVGKITSKTKHIIHCIDEIINTITYDFKPTAFWREYFSKAQKNTSVKLIKVK